MYDLFESPALTDEAQYVEALMDTLAETTAADWGLDALSLSTVANSAGSIASGGAGLMSTVQGLAQVGTSAAQAALSETEADDSGKVAGAAPIGSAYDLFGAFVKELLALNDLILELAAKGASEEQLAALAQSTLTGKAGYFGDSIGAAFGDSLGDAIGDAIGGAIGPIEDAIEEAIGEIGDAIAAALGVKDQTSEEAEPKEAEAAKQSGSEPEQLDLSQVLKADSFAFTFAA
ncbi:hypothetical protein C8J27_103312 [Rhodobacter aestuarii]|uniref:Uncharacterized protein n=1 Tax=Rhodobacter aestuarii TaxID=453582 RepID=A0A1N7JUQ7_9RHOB|nr:hypothetical protein [Rhodobacter aestuarii]PTV95981.1 hypothetical protein C8J27_103312 [Rhodobacter aestuarii]SIS53070.1 hypothetical protein SAMN05421580_102123 [Rhodobacter aestuarii]